MRAVSFRLMFLLCLYLAGCVSAKPVSTVDTPPPLQLDDRTLVASPDTVMTASEFEAIGAVKGAKSKMAEGASGGAGVGLRLGLESGFIVFPPAAAALVGGGAVIGGIYGGVVGAVTANEASEVDRVTLKLTSAMEKARVNSLLAAELQTKLKVFSDREIPLREEWNEEGSALYPKIVSAEFKEIPGLDGAAIVLKSTILRRSSTGEIKSFGNIDQSLGFKSLKEWGAMDDGEFRDRVRAAVIALSGKMSDMLLIVKEWDLLSTADCPSYRGLPPVSPAVTFHWLGGLEPTPVDSLNPVLSWAAYPRSIDIEKNPAISSMIEDLVYDLMVWNGHGLVYSRVGLKNASHRVEETLAPGTQYAWSVRPRFLINGMRRAISWGELTFVTCPLAAPGHESIFLFETPSSGRKEMN